MPATIPTVASTGKSDFELWMETNGTKSGQGDDDDAAAATTTLEQQISLAKQLYDEASSSRSRAGSIRDGGDDEDMSVTQIARDLRHMTCTNRELVRWKGIRVDWFLSVFCQSSYVKRLVEFGCELWFVRKVCIVEMLRRNSWSQGALVDYLEQEDESVVREPASTFLSYTGRFSLGQFIQILQQLRGEYIWMDIFCVDQFAWTGLKGTDKLAVFSAKLMDELQGQIQRINKTALMIERWNDTIYTLGQIWVLWEIFNTAKAEADFCILVPPGEEERYLKSMMTGSDEFRTVNMFLSKISSEGATAEQKSEQTLIRQRMENEGGLYNVDCIVTRKVRGWLIQSARRFLASNEDKDGWGKELATGHNNFSTLLADQGSLEEAVTFSRNALAYFQENLGSNDSHTMKAANNLANFLRDKGEFAEAESLFRQAVDHFERSFGPENSDTLASLSNLATLLHKQGKLTKAETFYEKVLHSKKCLLGPDHPETLKSLSNMGCLLHDLGRLPEAESFLRQAHEVSERVLGPEHEDTLDCANSLASLLSDQDNHAGAERLYRDTLRTQERLLGPDHPGIVYTVNNLANLLSDQDQLSEAEQLHRRALQLLERSLGPDHPDTLNSVNNLAILLVEQEHLLEAEPLFRRSLSSLELAVGRRHPNTLSTMSNLASLLHELDQTDEAARLYREVLRLREDIFGIDHPETMESVALLAEFCRDQGLLDQAEGFLRRSLEVEKTKLGPCHPDALDACYDLVRVLLGQTKVRESVELLRETLASLRATLGEDHEATLACQATLEALDPRLVLEEPRQQEGEAP